MNQADVLKTAEEAGFRKGGSVIFYDSRVMNYLPSAELTKFAELVAQHEAETIAKIIKATRWLDADFGEHEGTKDMLVKCILARKTK